MKKIIICDTNIWYNYAEGQYNDVPKDSSLIATWINLDELIRNPRLFKEDGISLVVQSLTIMKGFASDLKRLNPFDYISWLDNPTHKPNINNNSHTEDLLLWYNDLTTKDISLEYLLSIPEFKKASYERKLYTMELAEFIQDLRTEKGNLSRELGDIKTLLKKMIYINTGHLLSDNFDYNKIELFINVLHSYLDYINSKKQNYDKWKPNTWNDIANLVYVQPEMLYWTGELQGRDWRKTVPENMEKYFINK